MKQICQNVQWLVFCTFLYLFWASQVALGVKNPPSNAGDIRDMASTPRSGRSPEGGNGNPLQYSWLENPHGWRSLVGYSLWGHKESDMTEHTHTHIHTHTQMVFHTVSKCMVLSHLLGKTDPCLCPLAHYVAQGSQLEAVPPCRRSHLAMFGDIFACHK